MPDGKNSTKKTLLGILIGTVCVISLASANIYIKKRRKEKEFTDQLQRKETFVMPDTENLVLFKRYGHWIPYDFVNTDAQLRDVILFKVRPSDVFVVSFPKSGTTWVQEIVFQIMNVDSNIEDNRRIDEQFPYLEFVYPGIKELDKRPDQRFFKTHVQFGALPQGVQEGKGKVIYVARNVKDVTVSMFHFYKLITNVRYAGHFTDFCKIFNEGKVAYGPYWKHVAEYWKARNRSNVLFVTYEDLQKNPVGEIMKIADFLGKPVDQELALKIAKRCTFKIMKINPRTNYNWHKFYGIFDKKGNFMRKGIVGDWRNYYTYTLREETDKITDKHFKPLGLHIPDEL